jgi:GDPmannose 4,6-dehydratase
VTRKITYHAAGIKLGKLDRLLLGNLDALRDWGFAGDYVRAMHIMLQQTQPKDYVIGTGKTHSVREFVEAAFAYVGVPWQKHVVVSESEMRPADVNTLCADASLALAELGWTPSIGFDDLVAMMVEHDLRLWSTRVS